MPWQQVKLHKKHLLIAFAFASEWVLAFAFAKKFANAIADANYELAFADADMADVPRLRSLERRVRSLEVEHGRPWPTADDHAQAHTGTLD